jgi:hypothetical protein
MLSYIQKPKEFRLDGRLVTSSIRHLWMEWPSGAQEITFLILIEKMYGIDMKGRSVLELGAGCGICSKVCCENGAKIVVATNSQPDPSDRLFETLEVNVKDVRNANVARHPNDNDGDGIGTLLNFICTCLRRQNRGRLRLSKYFSTSRISLL